MTGSEDPLSIVALIGIISALLSVIYRELHGRIADRDQRIAKLEQQVESMTASSSKLASTSDRMLQYFLDREERKSAEYQAQRGSTP